jgi:hypothetical protein
VPPDDGDGWRVFHFTGVAERRSRRERREMRRGQIDLLVSTCITSSVTRRVEVGCSGVFGLVIVRRHVRELRRAAKRHGVGMRVERRIKPRWVELTRGSAPPRTRCRANPRAPGAPSRSIRGEH